MKIFIEDTAGDRFECDIPLSMELSTLAADFFDARKWPTTDNQGRGQRAVVELIDPENPDNTKRLRGDLNVEKAGLWEGAILRILPESIAGVKVGYQERLNTLIADHQEMKALIKWNPFIKFEANPPHAPTRYAIEFSCSGIKKLKEDGHTPFITNHHQVEITLGAGYPREAPRLRWLSPIFHPNISASNGAVCIGVLMENYLPGLGLARLVTMLSEMVQYRNFDIASALNKDAAKWAINVENWQFIQQIGGSPIQGPVMEMLEKLKISWREGERNRVEFKLINKNAK